MPGGVPEAFALSKRRPDISRLPRIPVPKQSAIPGLATELLGIPILRFRPQPQRSRPRPRRHQIRARSEQSEQRGTGSNKSHGSEEGSAREPGHGLLRQAGSAQSLLPHRPCWLRDVGCLPLWKQLAEHGQAWLSETSGWIPSRCRAETQAAEQLLRGTRVAHNDVREGLWMLCVDAVKPRVQQAERWLASAALLRIKQRDHCGKGRGRRRRAIEEAQAAVDQGRVAIARQSHIRRCAR